MVEKNIFRRNLHGKFVSAPPSTPSAPPGRARVNFRTFLLGGEDLEVGVVHLVVLDPLLRATTFLGKSAEEKERKI